MERILIDETVNSFAKMYEIAFRAYGYDVPGDLRVMKSCLDTHNGINNLSADELDQYKGYLEEVAKDYDNADTSKNLLVLLPDEFEGYKKKYKRNFPLVEMKRTWFIKSKSVERSLGPREKSFGN